MNLIRSVRALLTWPFDMAAELLAEFGHWLIESSEILERAAAAVDPDAQSPWEPSEDDYRQAANVLQRTEELRELPTPFSAYAEDEFCTADHVWYDDEEPSA